MDNKTQVIESLKRYIIGFRKGLLEEMEAHVLYGHAQQIHYTELTVYELTDMLQSKVATEVTNEDVLFFSEYSNIEYLVDTFMDVAKSSTQKVWTTYKNIA